MVKIKNKYFFSPVFSTALGKLKASSFETARDLYNAKRMCEQVEKHAKILAEDREAICAAGAKKGEDGKPLVVDNKYVFESPEAELDVINKLNELFELEIPIERTALTIESILSKEMTVNDLEILEPLFVEAKKSELVAVP